MIICDDILRWASEYQGEPFHALLTDPPYARSELMLAMETDFDALTDELEVARRLFILAWQGRGGPTARWNTGWRFQRADNRGARAIDDFSNIDHLWAIARRLKQVQIECDDALATIRRFDTPDTLFYIDPPYLAETRSKWGAKSGRAYDHEMTTEQHHELAALLQTITGMAIVSGYPSALYDELYTGWQCLRCESLTDAQDKATECLWLSPSVTDRARQSAFSFDEEAA